MRRRVHAVEMRPATRKPPVCSRTSALDCVIAALAGRAAPSASTGGLFQGPSANCTMPMTFPSGSLNQAALPTGTWAMPSTVGGAV